ncbi:hypothetical protein [Myceligenerans halotolerans]
MAAQPPVTPDQAERKIMARRLSGTVMIHGVDDENWPWANEVIDVQHAVHVVLDVNQPAARVEVPHVRWGGECRIELDLAAQVINESGTIQVNAAGRLYEGDSQDSMDLEDQQTVEVLVPRGTQPSSNGMILNSTGLGGGDWGEVKMSFTNNLFEEPGE